MTDPICHKARDEATDAVTREPDSRSCGHFISGPPTSGDEHESWRYAGFCHSKEEPDSNEPSIVRTRSCERNNNTPEEAIHNQVLGDRQACYQQCRRVFPEEIAKVEHRTHPGVLLAVKTLS